MKTVTVEYHTGDFITIPSVVHQTDTDLFFHFIKVNGDRTLVAKEVIKSFSEETTDEV